MSTFFLITLKIAETCASSSNLDVIVIVVYTVIVVNTVIVVYTVIVVNKTRTTRLFVFQSCF